MYCYAQWLLTNTCTIKNKLAHVLCICSLIRSRELCHYLFQQMNNDKIIVFVKFSVIVLISKSVMFFLQDVAVKVLSIQDFSDDQLKEFLREVCPVYVLLCFLL